VGKSATVGLVLLVAAGNANLRLAGWGLSSVGPRRDAGPPGWSLSDLLRCAATLAPGSAIVSRVGRPQRWELRAAIPFMFLAFAFPGFAWRCLRRWRRGLCA